MLVMAYINRIFDNSILAVELIKYLAVIGVLNLSILAGGFTILIRAINKK